MSARKMQLQIGRLVWFQAAPGLRFLCMIRDVRINYGRTDYQIEPGSGQGSTWVQASTVKPLSDAEAREAVK
jgi:hypothetical protein